MSSMRLTVCTKVLLVCPRVGGRPRAWQGASLANGAPGATDGAGRPRRGLRRGTFFPPVILPIAGIITLKVRPAPSKIHSSRQCSLRDEYTGIDAMKRWI